MADTILEKPDYLSSAGPEAEINMMRALRRHWLAGLGTAVAMVSGVAFYTNSQVPIYQSEALILLDTQSAIPVVDLSTSATVGSSKDRSTEVEILRSRPLVERAVADLITEDPTLTVGQVLGGLSARQIERSDILRVTYKDTVPDRIKKVLDALGSTYVDYSLESKRSQATNAIRFIEEQLPVARAALDTSAAAIRDFQEAYGIVNFDAYATGVADVAQALATQSLQAKIQLEQTRQQEQEILEQIRQLGQDPSTLMQQSLLSQSSSYQELAKQLQEIDIQLALERVRFRDDSPTVLSLSNRRRNLENLLKQEALSILQGTTPVALSPEVGSSTPTSVPLLRDSLTTPPLATAGLPATPTNAGTTESLAGIPDSGSLQQSLMAELLQAQTNLAVQSVQVLSINQAEVEVASRLEQIPSLQKAYVELVRQNQVDSAVVNNFLEKLQNLRITEAQETSPWRVLQPAITPTTPISPDLRRNLVLGLMAGVLSGLGIALLLESIDHRIKDVEEARALTGLPLLGAVPKVTSEILSGVIHNNDYTPFTEAFRSIAVSMGYLGTAGQIKTLLLTSAIPSEGKSTVSFCLGMALADLGHRVLIVDADMRKPGIHGLLNQPNAQGLSSVIASDRPWPSLIHLYSDHLHVLTAGPVPPNPIALLGSSKMTQLLAEWRQRYDYVLVDTPPVSGIADAQSIANQVDGVVYVLGIERSDRQIIARALELLKSTQANLVGMVVNLVDAKQNAYHYRYYTAYYGKPSDQKKTTSRATSSRLKENS
ncbi:MAG: polysaccharide biosynthesis tyrosine autokinase [Cyanobacteriota bacterium]|nr:polysaccharide biosynthesis tyrosine autokinase [Cyanobacteriota bacterium]